MPNKTNWKILVDLYGPDVEMEAGYVIEKLEDMGLYDKINDILKFWKTNYKGVEMLDHSNVRAPVRYDMSIILTWWLQHNFSFEVGDTLYVGSGGTRLKYHDKELERKVCTAVLGRGLTEITMNEGNKENWNKWLHEGLFEIPQSDVGKILKNRGG